VQVKRKRFSKSGMRWKFSCTLDLVIKPKMMGNYGISPQDVKGKQKLKINKRN